MLGDIRKAQNICIVCGYTDIMRRGIDGLAAIVQQNYALNPYTESLFLFCGKRRDRLKALLLEGKDKICGICGAELVCIGKEKVRSELVIIPQ